MKTGVDAMNLANEDSSKRSMFVFRGIEYVISATTDGNNGRTLVVEAEDKLTADQWRGKFDAAYIEELTRKTGNFKQFPVFVSMLQSALEKNSDSVMLDLLTYSDLELLRDRKAGTAGRPSHASQAFVQQNKRYLILIYSVEFDRIHYPLPLVYQGKPDPVQLQNMVRRLHDEIRKLKSATATSTLQDEDYVQLKEDYEEVLQEKNYLEKELNTLKMQMKDNTSFTISKEVRVLKKVVQNLELEMVKEKNRYQRLVSKKTAEIKRLSIELQELQAKERTLQIRVKSLTNELAIYKRTRNPMTPKRSSVSNSANRSRSRGVANVSSLSLNPSAARNRSQSRSRERPANRSTFSNRSASSERRPQSSRSYSRSRTPNPRFDPTSYVEAKRRKQRESEEKRKRRLVTKYTPGSEESERGRSRARVNLTGRSGSRDSYRSILRDRSSSLESRRSSNGSYTARRKPKVAWDYSVPKNRNLRKRSSTPDYERGEVADSRYSIGGQEYNDNMAEIDARLNALQQYMHELGTCN